MWKHGVSDSTLVSYKICTKPIFLHGNSGHVRGQVSIHLMHFAIWLPSPQYDLWNLSGEVKTKKDIICCDPPLFNPVPALVSEADLRKFEKEGLVNMPGWKCTLRNISNFLIVKHSVATKASEKADTRRSVLILPAWLYSFLKRSKTRRRLWCG